jgi:hypothetical protein
MTPQRITRQRTPGWKKPEGAIIVDRTKIKAARRQKGKRK